MNDAVLVKLSYSCGYCAVSTYSRKDKGHGRFLITKEILEKAMNDIGGHLFHDTDCANIVQIRRDGDTAVLMLYWLSVCSDSRINGLRQKIAAPIEKLEHVLSNQEFLQKASR